MGHGLHSRKTAVKIVDHIAKKIKSKVFAKITEQNRKICIIIDVVALASALNQIESPIICLFLLTSHVVRYNKRISIKVLNFPR